MNDSLETERLDFSAQEAACAWLALWRNLKCDLSSKISKDGDEITSTLTMPEPNFFVHHEGLGLPKIDAAPHLHLYNADEWSGAIKAMTLIRDRTPGLQEATNDLALYLKKNCLSIS